MKCWSCVRCINEWANGCWDANEMTWKNPCTTEWVNWWTNESTNQGINEPVSQWIRESLKQRSNDSMNQATSEPMNRWVSESKTQWANGCTIQRVNESLNLLNQWTKEAMNQWMKQFSQIHRPTAIWSLQFLWFFSTQQILWNAHVALATVWCTFCRPHLPKVCRSLQCFAIFVWNRALATVSCAFCRRHLPKVVFCRPHLPKVQFLKWKSSTCYSPGRFLSTTFADRAPQLRKQRHFDDHGSHFTRFHARECLHPWIRTQLNCCTSQLLDDGWLTWWCVWHDDGNANHDPPITRKFSN